MAVTHPDRSQDTGGGRPDTHRHTSRCWWDLHRAAWRCPGAGPSAPRPEAGPDARADAAGAP